MKHKENDSECYAIPSKIAHSFRNSKKKEFALGGSMEKNDFSEILLILRTMA